MTTTNDSSVLILDRAKNKHELAVLLAYREADDAGKYRITRTLKAALRGEIPSVEQLNKMTHAEKIAFADALPELQS